MIERQFNHDIRLETGDQEGAKARWPAIAHIVINQALIDRFTPHETAAKRFKLTVQWLGTAAVLMMLVALAGAAVELWVSAQSGLALPRSLETLIEVCGLLGVVLAFLVSRYGPFRRRWLKSRFLTECYRQWHFAQWLDGQTIDSSSDSEAAQIAYLQTRAQRFEGLVSDLRGSVGQKMDRLRECAEPLVDDIPPSSLPKVGPVRQQLLDAYRALRLDHQLEYAIYKLSPDDKTLARLSLRLLVGATDLLAGTTLVCALGCSILQLTTPQTWMPLAGVLLAIGGVAVRAWRDGLALGEEQEHYQEMRQRLEVLRERWRKAAADEERLKIAMEVEQFALEELRSFIRTHETAQFLF